MFVEAGEPGVSSVDNRANVGKYRNTSLGVTGGSALTLNRRPERHDPATTGSEPLAVTIAAPAHKPARPSRVSESVACLTVPRRRHGR